MKRESAHYVPADSLTMRAQTIIRDRLDIIIPYDTITSAIYDPLRALEKILELGDTLEFPNGTTVTVTWKPGTNNGGKRYG